MSLLARRLLSSSAQVAKSPSSPLVGPSHHVSNIRPVIYESVVVPTPKPNIEEHPYALNEFSGSASREGTSITPADKDEWVLKWTMMENDRSSHLFWFDSNTRFTAAKQALIDSYAALPLQTQSESTPSAEKQHVPGLDAALARFYSGWLAQEDRRQKEYTWEMYSRTWASIVLAARTKLSGWGIRWGS